MIPILLFHWFDKEDCESRMPTKSLGVRPSVFKEILLSLKNRGYKTILPDEVFAARHHKQTLKTKKPFMIMFDDGYKDFLKYASPILDTLKWKASIFMVSNQIGKNNQWDRVLKEPVRELLKPDEMKLLEQKGHRILSHTASHRDLTNLSEEDLLREMTQSRHKLEEILQHPVKDIAYPYGKHNRKVRQAARLAGYRQAFAVQLHPIDIFRGGIFSLPRVQYRSHHAIAWILRRFFLAHFSPEIL